MAIILNSKRLLFLILDFVIPTTIIKETSMSDGSNSTGMTILITVGIIVLLIAVVTIFLCVIQLRRRRRLNKMAL